MECSIEVWKGNPEIKMFTFTCDLTNKGLTEEPEEYRQAKKKYAPCRFLAMTEDGVQEIVIGNPA